MPGAGRAERGREDVRSDPDGVPPGAPGEGAGMTGTGPPTSDHAGQPAGGVGTIGVAAGQNGSCSYDRSRAVAERWRPVPGYEGLYEVSDQGRVTSIPR